MCRAAAKLCAVCVVVVLAELPGPVEKVTEVHRRTSVVRSSEGHSGALGATPSSTVRLSTLSLVMESSQGGCGVVNIFPVFSLSARLGPTGGARS